MPPPDTVNAIILYWTSSDGIIPVSISHRGADSIILPQWAGPGRGGGMFDRAAAHRSAACAFNTLGYLF